MNNEAINQVIDVLREKDNFLITAHINPEGDSIGSQLGMYYLLKKMGKKAVMVGDYNVPDNLKFLPETESILNSMPEGFHPDVGLVLDCPNKARTGKVENYLKNAEFMVNIDHHVSNEYFGAVNWVEPRSSSVGEMIYHIVQRSGAGLDYDISSALYTAIVTDTGMFNYENTTKETHEIAGKLLESGVNPKDLHGKIFESKSLAQIRLLGRVLATLKVEEDNKLAYMSLTSEMQEAEGIRSVATDEFINYPRSIEGVEVAVFFKERVSNPGYIDVSFRSSRRVDVDKIAAVFGGGGHKRASGCLIKGDLREAREKVLPEVIKIL